MDCSFFFKLLCFFLLLVGMSAAVVADDRRTYIIHVDKSAMPSPFPDHHSWYMSTLSSLSSPNGVLPTHLYTYNHVLDGFIAVTQILWRPRGLLVDQFDSKEDLINAVFTSSFIPGYLAPRPATMFSNRLCIDGGLTLFMPPTSATQTHGYKYLYWYDTGMSIRQNSKKIGFVFVPSQPVDWDCKELELVPTATLKVGLLPER
ncbi:hypothetical protein TEA_007147 [Camellia sinensis var. sinensis]|uniref:Inhibitor I9 domain-containing protein n=1 Tax=Camellia sinensis var. sinensis TaxID=542762 RepID=A0A4V3WJP8_CAMSN|nr:hypothetical protein TEA_007147 [Camellia sinensis var. sinensis]